MAGIRVGRSRLPFSATACSTHEGQLCRVFSTSCHTAAPCGLFSNTSDTPLSVSMFGKYLFTPQ